MALLKVGLLITALLGMSNANFCGDPEANITKSDMGTWRCGLYVMNALGENMKHLHTMQKLPGKASVARCAKKGVLSDPDEWDKLTEKCNKFMNHGLSGDFKLDKPLPPKSKRPGSQRDRKDVSSKEEEYTRTIGDELCSTVIKKHICGYKYAFCLSTCGGEFLRTNYTGPESICCKQVGKTEFRHVDCSDWRPFLEGRPVPEMCQDIVGRRPDDDADDDSEE